MKKYQKLWIAGVMAVSLLGTSFTATASANVVTEQTVKQEVQKNNKYESRLDAIIERGYILIGTPGDYKPFTYLNPTTGQYEGYDIDAMKEFAKSLGVEARFVQTSWSTLMDDLLANKFDIAVGGVTRNTDRQKQAYLSQGYIQFGKAPLIRAEDKDKYKTIEDINKPGVRIGVNPGEPTKNSFVSI